MEVSKAPKKSNTQHKRFEKTCVQCGNTYIGVKQSKICENPNCKREQYKSWKSQNLDSIRERHTMKKIKNGIVAREYNTKDDIESEVIKEGHCNQCGKPFNAESRYAQFCQDCRRTFGKKEIIINRYDGVDIDKIIKEHLNSQDGLITIIELMYAGLTPNEHQRIFDECYQELLNRYGRGYFEVM